MTDETVGPELPAATGGWTNGRTDCAGLAGCEWGKGAGVVRVLLSPGKRKDKEVRPGGT